MVALKDSNFSTAGLGKPSLNVDRAIRNGRYVFSLWCCRQHFLLPNRCPVLTRRCLLCIAATVLAAGAVLI